MIDDEKKIWGAENPFMIPDGYFENLQTQLEAKIDPLKATAVKTPRKLTLFAPWIGMAAGFLIIIFAYRQLPERLFPKQFENVQAENELTFDLPSSYFPSDFELMEYITDKDDIDINIYNDSTIFTNINEEDLDKVTLYN
jgi:hypothetical protein